MYLDTLHKTESGLYYMVQAKGAGAPVEEENGVYVRYSTLDLLENYMWNSSSDSYAPATSYEQIAKQLGSYSPATYYGPVLWFSGVFNQMEGIDEVLLTMREGDKRRIWLPSWLSSYGYGSQQNYTTTTIHDVEIVRVVPDIKQFEIDSLESYRDKYYPGVDSLSYGFYKKTLTEGVGDTLKVGDKLSIWYVGRLLDDFIFDLNIADTAKKYNIYNSEKSYAAYEGELKADEVFETTEGNSVVEGFSKAFFTMKHGEEAVVFFNSDLGYKADGSGGSIQSYTPLVFYFKVERTNFDEDEDEDEKKE